MEKIKYRLVWNRRKQLNQDGRALIQVECTLNKRKIYLSTHIFVKDGQWDKKRQLVIGHILADDYNARLFDFIINLEKTELAFWKRGMPVTLNLMKKAVHTKTNANISFIQFSRSTVDSSDRKESTKENIKTTIKALSEFRQGITFNDITYSFVKDFEQFLRNRGDRLNTIAKHLRQLRTLINESINAGYIRSENYPFRKIIIHQEKPEHIFLTETELKRMEHIEISKEYIQTKDAFLFCCYTGLRFSDFIHLKCGNVIHSGGHTWLRIKMIKTGMDIKLPLDMLYHGKSLEILSRYPSIDCLADIGSNAVANLNLKKIATLCKIRKNLHWHCSRHTFSVLLIEQGVPITTVQKLLGHTSVRTTQVYSEITASTIIKDLRRIKQSR